MHIVTLIAQAGILHAYILLLYTHFSKTSIILKFELAGKKGPITFVNKLAQLC